MRFFWSFLVFFQAIYIFESPDEIAGKKVPFCRNLACHHSHTNHPSNTSTRRLHYCCQDYKWQIVNGGLVGQCIKGEIPLYGSPAGCGGDLRQGRPIFHPQWIGNQSDTTTKDPFSPCVLHSTLVPYYFAVCLIPPFCPLLVCLQLSIALGPCSSYVRHSPISRS